MQQHRSQDSRARKLLLGLPTIAIGAVALIAYGLTRRSKAGTALAAAGGVLAFKAIKRSPEGADTRAVFLVNSSPEQAYDLWRDFEGLPRFMAHLQSVREIDGNRSEWVALGPGQRVFRWSAEITEDTPSQRIAWRSLPGSEVHTSGAVEFRLDRLGRGTFVSVRMQYGLPGGAFASGLAALIGKNPGFVVREDVRRFKQLLETGEVPTTHGQTHGPRGVHGYISQTLFHERTNVPEP